MLTTQVIGYLGNDATLKDVNDKKVLNFSVAHSEKFKNKEGTQVEKTTWVDCSAWQSDNLAPYLKKGALVCVIGQPSAHAYTSKDSELKASLRITVQRIELLGSSKKESEPEAASATTGGKKKADARSKALAAANIDNEPDDLPF